MGKRTSIKRVSTKKADSNERPLIRARREMDRLMRDGQEFEGKTRATMAPEDRIRHSRWQMACELAQKQLIMFENADRARWSRGTPETEDKIDRRQAALARLYERGRLSEDQFRAYQEIGSVIEMIKRAVSVKSISVEARVDCARGGWDVLIEGLARVRLEATYTAWRATLPVRSPPRAAIINLIETTQPLAGLAQRYRCDHRRLVKVALDALDRWDDIKGATWRNVDEQEVKAIYSQIGCGMLRVPKPKVTA